jgi:hypothetical protein
MRVTFLNVAGEVFFATGMSCEDVRPGSTWEGLGECVVSTGEGGCATLEVEGERVDIGPRSWMRLRRRPWVHRFIPNFSAKTATGHLWAIVDRDLGYEQDYDAPAAAVGVRG